MILGLDPGTRTGWAICRDGKITDYGVQTLDLQRGESPGMRFLRFRHWLDVMVHSCGQENLELISYERAHHRGGPATEVGVGLTTRIMETAAEHKIECLPVHTASLKKWATGNGRGDKSAMIAQALARMGNHPDADLSDDEADAVLVALWAWEQVR